jgi:Protein of unknown function (DUF2844)
MRKFSVYFSCAVLLIFTVSIAPAIASLGENESSIRKDPGALGDHVTNHSHYNIHETTIRGARVRQFAVPSGNVFGVSWSGKSHPDLAPILGAHYTSFEAALAKAKAAHRGRHPIMIEDGNIHVEMGGHFGSVSGAAWLIDQIPSGVNQNEIH